MAQQTLVVQVPKSKHAALRERFGAGTFEFRTVPHAAFSVKGEGTVATLYNSGKFVVQSVDPVGFLARFTDLDLPDSPRTPGGEAPKEETPREETLELGGVVIGSDETGKGDYFGPLVVAAVRLEPEEAEELGRLGITDSKLLSDDRALKLAAYLREKVPHEVCALDPTDYNARYPNYTGLNPLLADLHAEAIRELVVPGAKALVDQFAKPSVMQAALKGTDIELHQAPRAERHVAVAAASVIARAEFLLRLAQLSEQWAIELRKGAGEPVDNAGEKFARTHGVEKLCEVAKLHFKNTAKIEGRLRRY